MGRNIGGLSNIKTTQKAKIKAMPRVGGSEYLDLYMMTKEKARLEQEKSAVDKRKEQLETNLEDLERGIAKLEKTVSQEDKQGEGKDKEITKKKIAPKEWKTMTLNY